MRSQASAISETAREQIFIQFSNMSMRHMDLGDNIISFDKQKLPFAIYSNILYKILWSLDSKVD